jgi:hypothetical protein
MIIKNTVKTFIRDFYLIKYDKNNIIFCDENEGNLSKSSPNSIFIGKFKYKNVIVSWGNIKEITGIDYYHKNYVNDLTELFSDIYRNKITRQFFETLIEENINVSFTIKEMITYFPNLEN